MTWYPRKNRVADMSTVDTFLAAKRSRNVTLLLINCILCEGVGEKIDQKTGKIRKCSGCSGSGKMKNPKHKYQHA